MDTRKRIGRPATHESRGRFRRGRLPAGLLASAAFVLAVAGCGGSSSSTSSDTGASQASSTPAAGGAASASAKVDIANFKYNPPTITIKTGGTVTWTNSDATSHTATDQAGGSFDTGTLKKGQSKQETFSRAGTFSYVCLFHPFMHGTVRVVG